MAQRSLVRYNPAIIRAQQATQSLKQRNTRLREQYASLKEAAESRGRQMYRATLTQAGAFAAGAVSLVDEKTERTVGGVPAPAALGVGLITLGMFAPGGSYAADGLVAAGAGALAGWSFTKGQEAYLAWGREPTEETEETA